MKDKGLKAVVTGGAGFIGSHLAESLVNSGYYVTIIDDFSTGKIINLESILENNKIELIEGTITDLSFLRKLFNGVNYVFHQAAVVSIAHSVENPLLSHEVNATGSLNVLLAARDCGVNKVVCASSAAVYGDVTTSPQKEDVILNPRSPYAVTKQIMEQYCLVFNQLYKLPTVCLRYFNIYGPRQDPDSEYAPVIPKFIQSILGGRPPVIFGDGEQSRDFVYVLDAVSANLLAAESDATGIYNIATGKSISINHLAKLILQLTGKVGLQSEYQPERAGDLRQSYADISRAKALGYYPRFSLDEGLKETIKGFNA